ncbi:PLP-dependent aminotransferase family protein [Paenibacillus sp. GCM10012307]|uniref:PLP-dependent aminotransferase family protein n=1 Tax=Paenibacillus roseus TaxID=2798579 RepID=A0A934MMW2_9BACL|nr:PLP-dependent aminotransferase family protein [Paenibacillus roseus]MBJ6360356.1 PLP-dependent aminotransferase family protein [Paenibacillus roseus]
MQFHIPYHVYTEKYATKRLSLYNALYDSIVSGVLAVGTRLPSSRELAAMYQMSRGTVSQVYDMLSSEGYIAGGVGKGTFVAFQPLDGGADHAPGRSEYLLADWGERLNELQGWKEEEAAGVQADGEWAVNFGARGTETAFPDKEWHRFLYAESRKLADPNRLRSRSRVSTLGDDGLRESIAQYLRRTRGIAVDAQQIAIFNGSMQALALTAQLFINPGERVVVESPGYGGAVRAFQALGGVCLHAPVDSEGIIPVDWDAKLLFVTPNRQFPTGAVLSLERRQELLTWASRHNALIIEDDYDSEYRYRGKSLEPLKVLDREERVIYVGSFSNTLLSHVRIGYAVLPASLVRLYARAKALFDPYPCNLLEQRALAAWMQSGEYERHLRRMKRMHGRKFKLLREQLISRLSGLFGWVEGDAGLNLFGWWRGDGEDYLTYRLACRKSGIYWPETSIQGEDGTAVRYGAYFRFPHLSEEQILYGVSKMEEVLSALEGTLPKR